MLRIILILLVISFTACGQNEQMSTINDVKDFTKKDLPITLKSEIYSTYNFFGKEKWKPSNQIFIEPNCELGVGYLIKEEQGFIIIVYPEFCDETTKYILATINNKSGVVSKLVIMALIDDDNSINGFIDNNLSIKTIERKLIQNDNQNAEIKALEVKSVYSINNQGEFVQEERAKETTKYYNMDENGNYVLVK